MDKKKRANEYSVGYKKPPRHTQFALGQSGNPKGRPKRVPTFSDIYAKELQARIPITINGKLQKVSILEVIVKQHLKKAASGDSKAVALVFSQLKEARPDVGDRLSDLVQEFRTMHARHLADDRDERPVSDTGGKDQE